MQPCEHTAPNQFDAYFDKLRQDIVDDVSARLIAQGAAQPQARPAPTLKPFYTAKELATRWNFSKADTIYEIPEIELPRRRVGASRGKTLFYWLDVLTYEGTLTPKEAHAIQKRQLAVLEDSPQAPGRLRRLGNALDARQK
ncbi:MAG: hypothetical protein V3T15_07390 [Pseudomonadales bacterium]